MNNGTLDERLWVQQDANWNVTALVNGSGTVVERDVYDPYGKVTFLNASWGSLSGSAYAWIYLFQGIRLDPTSNLLGNRRREESLSLGRWTQIDPIGFGGGDLDLYRDVKDSPLSSTDSWGLQQGSPYHPHKPGDPPNYPVLTKPLSPISPYHLWQPLRLIPTGMALVSQYGTWSYKQTNKNYPPDMPVGGTYESSMSITFAPKKSTVNACVIDFVQILKIVETDDGSIHSGDRFTYDQRMTKLGWVVDSRVSDGFTGAATVQTGSSPDPYREAQFKDTPQGGDILFQTNWMFETFAVAKAGKDKGKVYGGLEWGFDVNQEGVLQSHNVYYLRGPTPEFNEAVAAYNVQTIASCALNESFS
jgi:RHS repeat-associated protein